MARNKSTGDDSLELLLDTICNMFGGIVLITILLAVIAQESGGVSNEEKKERVTEEVAKAQDMRLTFLSNELVRIDQLIPAPTSKSATPEVTAEELNKIKNLIAKISSDNRNEQTKQAQIVSEVDKIKNEIEVLEKQKVAAKTINVQVPAVQTVSNSTVFALIKNNAYYPLTDMSGPSTAKSRPFNQTICSARQGIMAGQPMIQLTLRKDAGGQLIGGVFQTTGHISELVNNIDTSNEVLFLVVYADSFGSFNKIKDLLVSKGIGYSWMPLALNQPIPPVISGMGEKQN